MTTTSCKNCQTKFTPTQKQQDFYDRLKIPAPKLCPPCRSQRRLAFRNERTLYQRKCDLTGKSIISIYPPEAPFPVYEHQEWFADKWEGLDHGQDPDFDRSFFDQFKELEKKVPKMSLHVMSLENSPYVNYCWHMKNVYLTFASGFCEDNYYGYEIYYSKNCSDLSHTRKAEISYWLISCQDCFNVHYCIDCMNCADVYFSFDCRSCQNIAFCSNLRNKKYHLFNKPVSEEEFKKFQEEFKKGSHQKHQEYLQKFQNEILANAIHKSSHNLNSENCTGDYLKNCQNCHDCYLVEDCQDLQFCNRIDEKLKDCQDIDSGAFLELGYEGTSIAGNNLQFGVMGLHSNNCQYFHSLQSCQDCFLCIGLKHKKYCILNKQYSPEEYEELRDRIIEKMKEDGEYGEFLPIKHSQFAYNETIAQEYFPLTKEEAISKAYKWKDKDQKEYKPQAYEIPDQITDVEDNIIENILACEDCAKNYKIIEPELKLYRKLGLPIPRKCPDCRYFEKKKHIASYELFERNCDNCSVDLKTTYAKDRPGKIYCEKCYLETVI
jgi:hypothetical protein